MGFRTFVRLSLLGVAFAVPLRRILESGIEAFPAGWRLVGNSAHDEMLELTFAVKQQGLEKLHSLLMSVSDPESADYGMHLTNEEVQALTAPAPTHLQLVVDFIRSHGVEPKLATPNGDFVSVEVPISIAEIMLSTKYSQVSHDSSGKTVSRAIGGYSLPEEVAAVVDFVSPTVHLPSVKSMQRVQKPANGTDGLGFNTPKNLRKLYRVDAEGKAADNKQAVTAFLDQKYSQLSLQAFWKLFCSGIQCGKGLPKLVGDETTGGAGTESMLDIETITGLAGNVESEFWGFSGRSPSSPENEPFLKWLLQLSNTPDEDVPKIFSTSYGEDEKSWSLDAAKRLNVEFQKAGVRGISLLFASGDEGANCKGSRFTPEWPSSSPYVTAVGGTAPTSSWPNPGGETAAGLSSGGFSDYWSMPDWQAEAVSAYMKQPGLPDKSVGYNVSGRAYPDISAQAENFFVYAGFPEPGVAGTSCASPTAAALFSLLNDLRFQAGKSSLGFLNPLVYKYTTAFNDVKTGSSDGGCSFGGGWPATEGWDAVTGTGTPDYTNLAKVISELPSGRQVHKRISLKEAIVV